MHIPGFMDHCLLQAVKPDADLITRAMAGRSEQIPVPRSAHCQQALGCLGGAVEVSRCPATALNAAQPDVKMQGGITGHFHGQGAPTFSAAVSRRASQVLSSCCLASRLACSKVAADCCLLRLILAQMGESPLQRQGSGNCATLRIGLTEFPWLCRL